MPVPDYQTLMLPVLKALAAGAENVNACLPALRAEFAVTDEEAAEMLPSGRVTYLQNRAHWARTYLSKAGLLTSPRRNVHVVTDRGRNLLAQNPERITAASLETFEDFVGWRNAQAEGVVQPAPVAGFAPLPQVTPDELIGQAHASIEQALAATLLDLLHGMAPARFERLILDLLSAMGYGAGNLSNTHLTRASGDGGIDGIIHEDALGLDAVYIQAKRYAADSKVGRPAIQQFIGSLTGEGASKGVFVTTSDFSAEARGYLARVQHRVVLINGRELAVLMIRYGVGVRDRQTFVIKGIDEDYFADTP